MKTHVRSRESEMYTRILGGREPVNVSPTPGSIPDPFTLNRDSGIVSMRTTTQSRCGLPPKVDADYHPKSMRTTTQSRCGLPPKVDADYHPKSMRTTTQSRCGLPPKVDADYQQSRCGLPTESNHPYVAGRRTWRYDAARRPSRLAPPSPSPNPSPSQWRRGGVGSRSARTRRRTVDPGRMHRPGCDSLRKSRVNPHPE